MRLHFFYRSEEILDRHLLEMGWGKVQLVEGQAEGHPGLTDILLKGAEIKLLMGERKVDLLADLTEKQMDR